MCSSDLILEKELEITGTGVGFKTNFKKLIGDVGRNGQINREVITTLLDKLETEKGGLTQASTLNSVRLNECVSKKGRSLQLLSNMLKANGDTRKGILANMRS